MTGKLSEQQMTWLRGLKIANRLVVMSASEIGDTSVSELQTIGLVRILDCLDGYNWRITKAGEDALALSAAKGN